MLQVKQEGEREREKKAMIFCYFVVRVGRGGTKVGGGASILADERDTFSGSASGGRRRRLIELLGSRLIIDCHGDGLGGGTATFGGGGSGGSERHAVAVAAGATGQ